MARMPVPGSRVSLEVPEGFVKATGFAGFEHPEHEATLGVTELPLPLAVLREQWQKNEALAREELTINGAPALWVHALDAVAGSVVLRWLLAVDLGERTVVVVAAAPEGCPEPVRDALARAVRTASLAGTASPGEELPFRFDEGPRLRVAARMGSVVLLTEGGAVGKDALAPMLTLGATAPDPDEDRDDLVRLSGRNLQAVPGLVDFEQLEGEHKSTIAGVAAYRLVGEAVFRGVEARVTLLQVVVAHGEQVWVAVGRCAEASFPQWAAEFDQVALSLRAPGP
jgi:hypothetical protein